MKVPRWQQPCLTSQRSRGRSAGNRSGPAPTFFANPREGLFKASPLVAEMACPDGRGGSAGLQQGWMDGRSADSLGSPGITLWRNVQGKRFERVPLPVEDATAAWGLTAIDIDNDGWLDLCGGRNTAWSGVARTAQPRPRGL